MGLNFGFFFYDATTVIMRLEILLQQLLGETEQNHGGYQSGQPVSGYVLHPGPDQYKGGAIRCGL